MSAPLVSIVLPTYNGARFIRQSIDSCLRQSFSDFELIIVNDCSTDNTSAIVQEYARIDSRIVVIDNPENLKLPLSLNAGFSAARGRYFTWTSDDNFYAPEAIATMVKVLDEDPAVGLVYTDYRLVDDEGVVFGTRVFRDINKGFNQWLGCGACFLYRREVHETNKGYNPAAFLIEDYEFFVRAFTRFQFKYLPISDLYYYREHQGSLTAQYNAIVNDMGKIFLERNLPALQEKLTYRDLIYLYRKLAVFYGGTKTHKEKYNHYLYLLRKKSAMQTLLVIISVPVIKLQQLVQVLGSALAIWFKK